MREQHTVEVTFKKDFDHKQFGNVEDFVESCLDGGRCRSYADDIHVTVIESDSEEYENGSRVQGDEL